MIGRKIIEYIDESEEVLSLDEAVGHGNVVRTDQNDDILAKIDEAIQWASVRVGFSIRRAYVNYYFDFPEIATNTGTYLDIPANVLSVEEVYYRNTSDTETALTASDYEFINIGKHIPQVRIINVPDLSSTGYAYRVKVVEGYYPNENGSTGNALDVIPYQVKSAIKMQFTAIYENRTDINTVQTYTLTEGAAARLVPFSKLQII